MIMMSTLIFIEILNFNHQILINDFDKVINGIKIVNKIKIKIRENLVYKIIIVRLKIILFRKLLKKNYKINTIGINYFGILSIKK